MKVVIVLQDVDNEVVASYNGGCAGLWTHNGPTLVFFVNM